ncbi:serine/threonine-protein kinase [Actinomycetota bacterium Odt1-20B]
MDPLRDGDPTVVGRYRILGRLGSGGMGAVFLGRSPGGRLVAVKCVHRELAVDAEFRVRFTHEMEAIRRVGGFHTADVVDADPHGDPPWMVTAYIPGPSLAEAVSAHGPLPESALRVLGAGLAEALDAIHAVGLVHRDLKPSNVLLADDGPRVIDFGIARALDGTGITRPHMVVGTPAFMAPEQISGARVGPACDVFSLGHVLCHAAGFAAFGKGDPQVLLYRVTHTEPDLRRLPEALRPVVAACLAKDPADRPTPASLIERFAPAHGGPAGAPGPWLPPQMQRTLVAPTGEPQPEPSDAVPAGSSPAAAAAAASRPAAAPPTAAAPLAPPAASAPPASPVDHMVTMTGPPAPAARRPASRRRRTAIVLTLAGLAVVGAIGASVPLLLSKANGHDTVASCFPDKKSDSEGEEKDTDAGASAEPGMLPTGVPRSPVQTAPADQATFVVGKPITFDWDTKGEVSEISFDLDDKSNWARTQRMHTDRCAFTPTRPGVYRWSVSTAQAGRGKTGSVWSEQRYFVVTPKDEPTGEPRVQRPHPPHPLTPADRATATADSPVTLTWKATGPVSRVAVQQPDGSWRHQPWMKGSSYSYTPPGPGRYVWIVFTASKADCASMDCTSGASEQRYLLVR